ncbi:SDR family oxidoreductase [Solimonas terrae]|uniref:SDR family oxidoreductase n=1 Tax=Solimonas terrae TaxID=1396819 RepID=A0A6M2BUV3_9GAMM|nr:SDR family oxidoreductase [Solimonas terrae]NGY05981.1 SDR family oxidoreductase [Solimonas terrae]
MKLRSSTVLLTGASGGIGHALAREFAARGARLLLNGRDSARLGTLSVELRNGGAEVNVLPADLTGIEGIERLAHAALSGGTPDLVVHCADSFSVGCLETTSADEISRLWQTNVIAPSLLTRALLPSLRKQGRGRIVFVGSIFGSLGLPMYATYSATKFALRGLAEALRRELDGSGIGITYVAPRCSHTQLDDRRPERGPAARTDKTTRVAVRIADAIERDRRELYFGFGERCFVRLNAWFPWLVDRSLRAQTRRMRKFEPAIAGPQH